MSVEPFNRLVKLAARAFYDDITTKGENQPKTGRSDNRGIAVVVLDALTRTCVYCSGRYVNTGFPYHFLRITIRYAEHLPSVLKHITWTFSGRKEVGVVGRTGRGKSTLIQAIFRIVEPREGPISTSHILLSEYCSSGSRFPLTVPSNIVGSCAILQRLSAPKNFKNSHLRCLEIRHIAAAKSRFSSSVRDRAEDYARKLEGWGKKVEYVEFEGKQHGFFTVDPNSPDSDQLMLIIKRFIIEN
ncbi:hypothetical protein TEA_025896 [Camellia sinensis var. sinensis]|uniref:ABC transporter domain-containing protein n=1 Tax=Camellia sinensis var. sinensis TaxID=542762 RepID=A0A4S4DEK4_CAMSN|nr:hypothetical protein TEA_025896 [Camellia sinensis var. sinensis]